MNMPMTLKVRLIAAIMLLLAMTIIAISATYYSSQKAYLTEKNLTDLKTVSQIMVNDLTSALLFNDPQSASNTIKSLKFADYIVHAEVFDKNDDSFSSYHQKMDFIPLHSKSMIQRITLADPMITFRDKRGLHIYTGMFSEDERIGVLYLMDDLSELSSALNRLFYSVALTALIVAIISILLGLKLVDIITQPLNEMLTTIREITEEKNYTPRTPTATIKEFKELSHAFNEMISEIEQRDQRLAEINVELEERVKARTTELETTLQLANQAIEAKSNFLAIMGHELRTPLNGIIGFSELLAMTEVPAEAEEQIALLNQSASNLMELLNEILDFSKLEADKVELEEKSIDAFSFMNSLLEINKIKAKRKDLKIVLEVDERLRNFTGDPLRLRQVLNNFIDNAIKFTHQGHVTIKLKKQLHRKQPTILFEVQDTGTGIRSEQLEHIFNPFSQADNTVTRKYGGTGLGLAICSQLINLMDGAYGVESEIGKGSLFWFRLPLRQNDQVSIDFSDTRSTKQNIAEDNHLECQLLLAEDNETNQKLAVKLFAQFDLVPDIANNGREAIEMATQRHYDLIFMDYHMPEMSGLEAIEHIRDPANNNPNMSTPIIAMTADTQRSINNKLTEAGVDEVFLKPYRFADLKALLDRWV